MSWLKRFIDRFRVTGGAAEGSEQQGRVSLALYRRSLHDTTASFLDELLEQLPPSEVLEEQTLALISAELRGHYGQESEKIGDDYTDHVAFWRRLSERFPNSAYASACYADVLLIGGAEELATEQFLSAVEKDPVLLYEFDEDLSRLARAAGGESWLRYQLAALQAAIETEAAATDDEPNDLVRELYGELLEEYADDEPALARVQRVGARISELTNEARLPRAFVRRGPSRSKG